MKNLNYLVLLTLIVTTTKLSVAQKTIQEAAELDEKKFEKLVAFDRVGYGYLKTFLKQNQLTTAQLPELKEIALLSFILFDNSMQTKGDSYDRTKASVYTYLTENGGDQLVNTFYDEALPGIKAGLGSKTLLLPNDYLSNDQEQSTYNNADIKPNGLIGAVSSFMGQKNDLEGNAVPEGYTLHLATFSSPDVKLSRSVGKLATDLDVKAFLTTQISVEVDKKNLYLANIKMALHVPNPAPYDADRKYPGFGSTKGYWEGLCLGSLTFSPKKPIEIASIKKGSFTDENFAGLEKVLEQLTESMIAYVNENLTELKE